MIHRSIGFYQTLPPNELYQQQNITKVSLVISHCDLPVDWIPDYIGKEYKIKDIIIYSKCSKAVEGIEALTTIGQTKVIALPNVGRCDHSYAYWIKEHYVSIRQAEESNDIVFFMKDNNYHQHMYRSFDEIFTTTVELGFGCALSPIWCDCPEGGKVTT